MALTTAGANLALDALASPLTMGMYTGAPGDTGASNEVTGGTYARQSITLAAASAKSRTLSNSPVFNIPSGNTVSHYAIFSGATCVDTGALPASQAFASDGTLTVTAGSVSIS